MSDHLQGLRRNISALLLGQASRLIVQATYFVLLARLLEPSSFGLFTVIVALGALISPFTALGLNTLMVRSVSRDDSLLRREWNRGLVFTTIGGLASAVFLTLLIPSLIEISMGWTTILLILVADLVGLRLADLSASIWHTIGRSGQLVALPTAINAARLIGVGALFLVGGEADLARWAWFYFLATVPLGVSVACLTSRRVGLNLSSLGASRRELGEGLLFSVSLSSQSAFNDIDKTILANLQSAASAGIYAAAYRIIDMAYAPIRSVAAAIYPRLFRAGSGGVCEGFQLIKGVAPMVFAFGVVGSVGAYIVAPYTPLLLGADYAGAVDAIRLLAPLVLLRGMSFMAADLLSATGRHGFRTAIQLMLVMVNIVGNILLIPQFGLAGAVISTLACETLLLIALWLRVIKEVRLSRSYLR